MKEIVLQNTSNKDITDYPISEAVLDRDGNPRIDSDTQQPVITGETYTWSLAAGEVKVFPAYVANYLRSIYEFLEEAEVPEEVVVEEEEAPKKEGALTCKVCGKEVANMRGMGLHVAAKHPKVLE